MRNATVKWFNAQKGYGFLTDSETKEDVFCHYSQLQGAGKNGREQAINVKPILTMKMVKDSLKEENLYVKTMKDVHKVTKYMVVDANNAIQTSEQGMDFLNLAAYAGFDTEGLTEQAED